MWRGWLRLYLVVAIPWIAWFGYDYYHANRLYWYTDGVMKTRSSDPASASWLAPTVSLDELQKQFEEYADRREFSWKALFVFPIGAPVLFFAGWWVVRGFRKQPVT